MLNDPDPFETGSTSGLRIGDEVTGNGSLTVIGPGSQVTAQGEQEAYIHVGDNGRGVLDVRDGGIVSTLSMTVAADPQGIGTVTVSGPDAAIALSGASGDLVDDSDQAASLKVGFEGTGDMTVDGGGMITISGEGEGAYPALLVGEESSATGSVTITGAASSVVVRGGVGEDFGSSGAILVGWEGEGDMTVADGARLTNAAEGVAFVGRSTGSDGQLVVEGPQAAMDAGLRLFIGSDYDFQTSGPVPDQGGTGDVFVGAGGRLESGDSPNDDIADIVLGPDGALEVADGGTLVGDIRIVGGRFDLADGANHEGEVLG